MSLVSELYFTSVWLKILLKRPSRRQWGNRFATSLGDLSAHNVPANSSQTSPKWDRYNRCEFGHNAALDSSSEQLWYKSVFKVHGIRTLAVVEGVVPGLAVWTAQKLHQVTVRVFEASITSDRHDCVEYHLIRTQGSVSRTRQLRAVKYWTKSHRNLLN